MSADQEDLMRAVLFDLDGTLLDIDIDAFLHVYFGALGPVLAEVTGMTPKSSIDAVIDSTGAMMRPHPGLTNRETFDARFSQLTGVDLGSNGTVIADFYRDVFPSLGAGLGPMPGARQAVQAASDAGMVLAVATNPIFPAAAVSERIRWAGLDDVPFALVTTYETMHACKPERAYFEEAAGMLGVQPSECLMVGDDVTLDMGATSAGMITFFTGSDRDHGADYAGDLRALAELLSQLAEAGDGGSRA